MKKTFKTICISSIFILAFLVSFAQTPRDLRSVEYMSYVKALKEIKKKGYDLVDTSVSGGNTYITYWHDQREKCVTLRVHSNDVQSIVEVPNYDCHKDNSGNELSGSNSWSNNSNNRYYHNDRDNWRHTDDREYNSNYSYGNKDVKVHDLVGRDALSAYDELNDRGFKEQKKYQDKGNTFRVWYNYRTHQCIKTLSQKRRIDRIYTSTHCNTY
ncbi:hypothetical protein KO493_09985 [Tamlana agarivorans]|uniref:Uncharacterized protein n=1 Tax=Pseudotamlana agarivorans TaxID=481183 RepID=A0ACC5U9P4_9FLAO|nr:hypothetical protein [Tamlana agarivorans]MBU2951026.1 hypothetical protein [Tamlana agarivorans]